MRKLEFDIISLFPEMFLNVFETSILGRAQKKGLVQINLHNLRDNTYDRHHKTDDMPYGGGAGMVMKVEPVVDAIEKLCVGGVKGKIILMTPQGKKINQGIVRRLSKENKITLVCSRYEGVDDRIRGFVDEELSIGDYILTGGEIPAMVLVDSVVRLIPGVLGDDKSVDEESFSGQFLEYPQYTRPKVFRDLEVPDVLLSGNHEEIRLWRKKESIKRTVKRRPDLLSNIKLGNEEKKIIKDVSGEE